MLRRCVWRCAAAAQRGPFDPYKILGVSANATPQEVKRAYRRLALRYHPDGGPEGDAARFAAVHEAYEAVKNGAWVPPPPRRGGQQEQQHEHGAAAHGGVGGAGARMYVYEEPGSTTEGYVTGHTATLLRVFMWWCFVFVALRLFLLRPRHAATSPPSTAADLPHDDGDGVVVEAAGAAADDTTRSQHTLPRAQVHDGVHTTSRPRAHASAVGDAAPTATVTHSSGDEASLSSSSWWQTERDTVDDPLARRS